MNNCPSCGVSWLGEPISKDIADQYDTSYWKREIGIDGGYVGVYDGVVALKCPDCGHECPRDESEWAKDSFEAYQVAKKWER
jgi:predicted RNA-binding Zn-ribbon protein involved in translation (DUF1610 family)